MPSLSVVIITLNEEHNIGRCLESVKDIADDIVVVDSGSTDRTQEICSTYGVRFIRKEWLGYSAQKNYANSLANFDWIFSIDADEALSDQLKQSILEAKTQDDQHYYRIGRITNYCGKWIRFGGWYPDIKLRFFDRRQNCWEGHIHERLNVDSDTAFPLLQGDCYHYSYYTVAQHQAQALKFSRLAAEDLFSRGKQVGIVKLWFAPLFKFIKMHLLQGGFLDGRAGLTIARISAHAVFLKYRQLREYNAQRTN
jgi:glycosyltransferase involved in cell wall biosynthesis